VLFRSTTLSCSNESLWHQQTLEQKYLVVISIMETALDKQRKHTPTNIFNQENPSESLYM